MKKWTSKLNFIIIPVSVFFIIANKPIYATIGLLLAALLLWFNHSQNPINDKRNSTDFVKKLIILIFIPICTSWYSYFSEEAKSERKRNFLNYLQQHDCKYVDDIVTGVTQGGCDRYGNCQDSEPDYEPYFKCRKTGNDITFSEFKKGYFGSPSDD